VVAPSESGRAARLSGAVLVDSQLPGQWCYRSPRPDALREDLLPGKTVLAFHWVVEGTCVASLPGEPPVQTAAGELLLFPQGAQHILASSMSAFETLRPREVRCDALRSAADDLPPSELASTRLICGYLSCGGDDAAATFARLPNLIRLRGDEHFSAWMHASMAYCTLALAPQKPSSTLIAEKILEFALLQALRQQVGPSDVRSSLSPRLAGRDRFLQRALAMVHSKPSHPWTVDELSRQVGLSRSALAAHFVRHLGEPPKQYLARWRLALAADALRTTPHSAAQIATNVGYESEAAFSRAFKRVYGLPPATWRRNLLAGKE
jgi:AraC-like DNA-binding protein